MTQQLNPPTPPQPQWDATAGRWYLPGQYTPYPPHPASSVQYVYVQERRWNGTAIAGFVFSLLWLWGIGSLIGFICGLAAAKEARLRDEKGGALATWAWVLGLCGMLLTVLVVIAISSAKPDYSYNPSYVPSYSSSYSGSYGSSYGG